MYSSLVVMNKHMQALSVVYDGVHVYRNTKIGNIWHRDEHRYHWVCKRWDQQSLDLRHV